jgi:putative DNA methylase
MTMSHPIRSPRKLIEVALPLDAINVAAAREKSIRHGHPSTLHLWWARRPLAVARAVIFAQLVNDPGYQQGSGFKYGKNKKEAAAERKRLFKIVEELVLWENTANEVVLEAAREEIRRSWREVCELNKEHPQAAELFCPNRIPGLHDPFAGGGTIPMEAQRLGMDAYASDLNPVAVLINKAMIEIPRKFVGHAPVGPLPPDELGARLSFPKVWQGATGLAEDVRRYGSWMRAEAQNRIGHLYPPVEITADMTRERPDLSPLVGQKLTVIAWLWARTVKSPNPAISYVEVPLVSTFILSSKEGKKSYVHPVVEGDRYRFSVRRGTPPPEAEDGTKAKGRGANFRCIISDVPISGDYIKTEGQAGRMGTRLMAVVAEGLRGRVYLSPTSEMEAVARRAEPTWKPDVEFLQQALGFRVGNYGMTKWSDLFTPRQLVALTTFSDLIAEARTKVRNDAIGAGMPKDDEGLEAGGTGTTAYAEAVCVYLAFVIDKSCVYWNTLCPWLNQPKNEIVGNSFSRQAVQMVWDFAEANPFSDSGGNTDKQVSYVRKFLEEVVCTNQRPGNVSQANASDQNISAGKVISTDPPYYDNIGYADLSDFFYVWLRRALRDTMPRLFAMMSTPKSEELVATPARHGGSEKAELFFLNGMKEAMQRFADQSHPSAPLTIYYSFKQADNESEVGTSSKGWATFLDACFQAGLQISGTWPARTERPGRMRDFDSNALASSIVLVCRKRIADAPTISRREFLRELNAILPEALDEMTKGSGDDRSPVAPVDLSQAIIGPGMAVFSKYASVLEADGSPMSVRTALQLINRFLVEDDFDPDTQFCLHWFEQHGWGEGRFGDADTLSRAKGTSVDGMRDAGVVESGGGIVRLRRWSEYSAHWDPQTNIRNPVWETLHHLIRALKQEGETGAGRILAAVKGKAEVTRQLAYRLYTLCERQGWAEDARAYNELITSWSGIETASGAVPTEIQSQLFD